MRVFIRQSKSTAKISCRVLLLAFLAAIALTPLAGQQRPPAGVKLEVVSVRVLSDKESTERSADFIGQDIAIRLRLSCSDQGIYFYTLGDSVIPVGYHVKSTDRGIVWLAGRSGEEKSSPGIAKLTFGLRGSWRVLSAYVRPAIEWEELDSTHFTGEKHAFTIFIKLNEKDEPKEILSASYVVPAGTPPPK